MSQFTQRLRKLIKDATFKLPVRWHKDDGTDLDLEPDEDNYVFMPELATLGDTSISMMSDYEDRGNDARLIEEGLNALPQLLRITDVADKLVMALIERGVETSVETGEPVVRCTACRSPWAHRPRDIVHAEKDCVVGVYLKLRKDDL